MKPSVERAIAIYKAIQQELGNEYLAYWVLPNIVLTLSGARAYCDSVFWDDQKKDLLGKWKHEISQSLAVVAKQIDIVWSEVGVEEPRPEEQFTGMQLMTKEGLRYAENTSELLKSVSVDDINFSDPKDSFDTLAQKLKSQFQDFSEEDLRDVAFGILLGYPDKAIVESIPFWAEERDVFAEKLVDADVRGADYYICPQPVYSYPRHLMNDPKIVEHEAAWTNLLKAYYLSDFHKALEKDKAFRAKMRELGNLR